MSKTAVVRDAAGLPTTSHNANEINRSPRALPLPEPEMAEEVIPAEMREDYFERRSMSPWRRRREGLDQRRVRTIKPTDI